MRLKQFELRKGCNHSAKIAYHNKERPLFDKVSKYSGVLTFLLRSDFLLPLVRSDLQERIGRSQQTKSSLNCAAKIANHNIELPLFDKVTMYSGVLTFLL